MYKFVFQFIIFMGFGSSILTAQNSSKVYFTNSKLDKVVIQSLQVDSLVWYFEDFKKSLVIDERWQDLLSNKQLYSDQQQIYKSADLFDNVSYDINSETLKHQLQLLNAKTPLDIGYHPDLENVIKFYLKRNSKITENLISLSQYYFPLFEEIFDRYDVPLEIKYLAIVESALNPKAKSWVGAAGLWQFMYQTGKIYDLEVNSYVDERMDPVKSTIAAAKYLRDLYAIFDDWNLALAAYNSGPGNVNKAIRRSGGQTNYWAIRPFLPKETAGYVPSFFALMYIFENMDTHKLNPTIKSVPYIATDTIRTKNLIKLEQVAEITQTKQEFIEFLNPSYKLGIIPNDSAKTYFLRLPYKAMGVYVANEDDVYAYAQSNIKQSNEKLPEYVKMSEKLRYRVRSGDFLGKIARKYSVRVSDIKRWNGLKSNNLKIGQRLTIYPKNFNTNTAVNTSKNSKKSTLNTQETTTYTVQDGDSLWSISRKFKNVSINDIKKSNNLKGNKLKPGMVLKISS